MDTSPAAVEKLMARVAARTAYAIEIGDMLRALLTELEITRKQLETVRNDRNRLIDEMKKVRKE